MARLEKGRFIPILLCCISLISYTNCIKIGSSVGHGGGTQSQFVEKSVVIKVKVKQPQVIIATTTATTTTGITTTTTTAGPLTTFPKLPIRPNSTIETGIGCGTKLLRSGEVVRIQSNNFNTTNYPDNDACTWKFIGKECTVTAECPCIDIPPSFNCLEDYLKIIDLPFYHQKFCGSTQPNGIYRASSEIFTIRFRSNQSYSGKGFLCYVQCTPPGWPDQTTPSQTQICPNFSIYTK